MISTQDFIKAEPLFLKLIYLIGLALLATNLILAFIFDVRIDLIRYTVYSIVILYFFRKYYRDRKAKRLAHKK